jgi:phosphatidylglycerol:prolipoprotein diacylglycerol transferase
MHPKLFEIPFIHWPVPSYGLMMVIAFLVAVSLIRYLSRNITPNPQYITNASLYSLIAGVVGARLFYVIHHFDDFQGRLLSVFAIWSGGLELLGGVLLAIAVIGFYCRYHKLPVRRYLDILAIGLMLALAFGRIGCFLNGCCFGRPTNLPWAVRFPYGSHAYHNQVNPDLDRNRPKPYMELPSDFFVSRDGLRYPDLKPYEHLTQEQKYQVDKGPYRCLPVHPTQLYSSVNGAVLCLILYLFWRKAQKTGKKLFSKPGQIFSLMFILYGVTRFFIEFLRNDNPFEYAWWAVYKGGTVSQNLGIYMAIFGVILMAVFQKMKPDVIASAAKQSHV